MKTLLLSLAIGLQAITSLAYGQATTPAAAANDKPIRLVVPFAAGGPTDVLARVLAPRLSASLKRTVIVDNKVGATGAIGASFVAKAAADGDTLLLGTSSIMAASPNLTLNLPYDPV